MQSKIDLDFENVIVNNLCRIDVVYTALKQTTRNTHTDAYKPLSYILHSLIVIAPSVLKLEVYLKTLLSWVGQDRNSALERMRGAPCVSGKTEKHET